MTKEITRLEKSVVRLDITIPREELREEYEKALNELMGTVQIAGFRKGKVPRNVLERKLGGTLQSDVLNGFVGETVKKILEDEAFPKEDRPIQYSEPVIEGDFPKFDLENDLKFSVKWDAMPVFEVESWKGFTVEIPSVKVEAADVGRALEQIRERNAFVMDRQPGETAQTGDIVRVDYAELDDTGGVVAETRRDGFVWTLGSGKNEYQFDEDVVGMKVGETKTITKNITKSIPGDSGDPDSIKKTVTLSLTVLSIKEQKLPDLDDDLAQDVHESFKTLDDLKKNIRETLKHNLEQRLEEQKLNAILEKIIEKTPIELPESLIKAEIEFRIVALAKEVGVPEDQIEKIVRAKTHAFRSVVEKHRESIVQALKVSLVQQKLVHDLKIEVGDDERDAELTAAAKRESIDLAELKERYEQDDQRTQLDEAIATKKMRTLLLKENTVGIGAKQSYKKFMEGAE